MIVVMYVLVHISMHCGQWVVGETDLATALVRTGRQQIFAFTLTWIARFLRFSRQQNFFVECLLRWWCLGAILRHFIRYFQFVHGRDIVCVHCHIFTRKCWRIDIRFLADTIQNVCRLIRLIRLIFGQPFFHVVNCSRQFLFRRQLWIQLIQHRYVQFGRVVCGRGQKFGVALNLWRSGYCEFVVVAMPWSRHSIIDIAIFAVAIAIVVRCRICVVHVIVVGVQEFRCVRGKHRIRDDIVRWADFRVQNWIVATPIRLWIVVAGWCDRRYCDTVWVG